jgi:transcriptional regulator with XRE-family HTH domain
MEFKGIRYSFPLGRNISLRPVRKALGMSREELAVELGVCADSIGRWERGESPVNKSARKHLERVLRQRGVNGSFFVDPLPNHPKNAVGKAG